MQTEQFHPLKQYLVSFLACLLGICSAEAALIETSGIISNALLENDGLHFTGYVYTFTAAPLIDTLKIAYLEKETLIALDVPEKKVSFDISIYLNQEEKQSIENNFVSVTPISSGLEGYSLYYLVNTSLPLPPQQEVDVIGGGDCMTTGCEFFGLFIERGGIKPSDTVLDIGCGVGRMAYPLTRYLKEPGLYYGFDIIPSLISRAQNTITPAYPNFDFQLVDIYNKLYNPQGNLNAQTFQFPYEERQFDFVFLTSVFTHLTFDEYDHYLDEIYRVLKQGGKCMATMFLLDHVSIRQIAKGKSGLAIKHPLKNCLTSNPNIPEAAVGYYTEDVKKWLTEKGFIIDAIYPGSWGARERDWVSYQDIVLFSKS